MNGEQGYDWIVVGGGSAGCVLANRLSADPDTTVLLLEAGGSSPPDQVWEPPAWPTLVGTAADWGSTMVRGEFTHRVGPWARGRGLGGSSLINAMGFLRGHRSSYDRWSAAGLRGWDFDSLLPYFQRIETSLGRSGPGRGHDGPMVVRPATPAPALALALVAAAEQVGEPVPQDVSAGLSLGIGLVDLAIVDGRRLSVADAYLTPVERRTNLVVRTNAHVRKLLFDGTRCTGLELQHGVRREVARVRPFGGGHRAGEVVLSAGCVGSPQLLMLSGIGPAADLEALGIDVLVDAPQVGANFHDHPMTGITWNARNPLPVDPFQHSEALGLIRSRLSLSQEPDLQILSLDVPVVPESSRPPASGYSLNVALMAPRSRGSVRLVSADPLEDPLIDPNYLADEHDRSTIVEGLSIARRIGNARAFDELRGEEAFPGDQVRTEAGLLEHARATLGPYSHGAGTCAMGTDLTSVVDQVLAVRGTQGLRVVDASVIPTVVSGNIHATVLAVAEKAADLLGRAAVTNYEDR